MYRYYILYNNKLLYLRFPLTDSQITIADMNGDGVVNVLDIVTLINTILG